MSLNIAKDLKLILICNCTQVSSTKVEKKSNKIVCEFFQREGNEVFSDFCERWTKNFTQGLGGGTNF